VSDGEAVVEKLQVRWFKKIHDISVKYNTDKKNILKYYFNHVIRKKPELVSHEFLSVVETIMHTNDFNVEHILQYFLLHIRAQRKDKDKIESI